MKFKVSSQKLKKISSLAQRITGGSSTLPILNDFLLELKESSLFLSATNLEIGLTFVLPVELKEEGKVALPGKVFSDFVGSFREDKEIEFEKEGNHLLARVDNFEAKILTEDPEEFPSLPQVSGKEIKVFPANFISSLPKVSKIVSPTESRIEISGVLLKFEKNKLYLVGTDSIRLAEKKVELEDEVEPQEVILPQKTAKEVEKIFSLNFDGEFKIHLSPNQIGFSFEPSDPLEAKIFFVSKVIEGSFPQYKEIIPKTFQTKAILEKEEFQRKIKTLSLFAGKIEDIQFKFSPKDEKITLISRSEIGEAKDEIKGKIEGDENEITFNWKYLLEGLSLIDSSEVFFGVNTKESPSFLQGLGEEDYLYILMPKTV